MISSVVQLLPIALAAALSSVPISIMVVILLSARRRATAAPYLVGSVLGAAIVVTVTTALAVAALPVRRPRLIEPWVAGIEIVAGLALLVVAVISWRRRRAVPATSKGSRWTPIVNALTPIKAFGLGLLLSLRAKNLLLATIVSVQLRDAKQDAATAAILIAIYVLIATCTLTVPILLTLLNPTAMEPRLNAAVAFLAARGRTISAIAGGVVAIIGLITGIMNATSVHL
jgi:hypothetical protein